MAVPREDHDGQLQGLVEIVPQSDATVSVSGGEERGGPIDHLQRIDPIEIT
jgi:hypothetical protein